MHTAILLGAMACAIHPHCWARPFPMSGPSACQSCSVPLPGHGPGMYDYRIDIDYPWSNTRCANFGCGNVYFAEARNRSRQTTPPLRLGSARGEAAKPSQRLRQ